MASLFSREDSNIRRHVLNAFKEGELERDNNNVHFLHVNGVKKPVPYYSLDVIISVGYRVRANVVLLSVSGPERSSRITSLRVMQ